MASPVAADVITCDCDRLPTVRMLMLPVPVVMLPVRARPPLSSTTVNYSNTSGASALSAANGRWLVYSSMPSLNAFGGLLSGNGAVYNATYTANLPATIGAGNRYVFSQQPTAVITANGQTRVYDGATNFAPVTHTVTGLIDASLYGNVFNQDILTGSLAVTAPGKNVGTYAIGIGSLT
eukprot:gene20280-24863_t